MLTIGWYYTYNKGMVAHIYHGWFVALGMHGLIWTNSQRIWWKRETLGDRVLIDKWEWVLLDVWVITSTLESLRDSVEYGSYLWCEQTVRAGWEECSVRGYTPLSRIQISAHTKPIKHTNMKLLYSASCLCVRLYSTKNRDKAYGMIFRLEYIYCVFCLALLSVAVIMFM